MTGSHNLGIGNYYSRAVIRLDASAYTATPWQRLVNRNLPAPLMDPFRLSLRDQRFLRHYILRPSYSTFEQHLNIIGEGECGKMIVSNIIGSSQGITRRLKTVGFKEMEVFICAGDVNEPSIADMVVSGLDVITQFKIESARRHLPGGISLEIK